MSSKIEFKQDAFGFKQVMHLCPSAGYSYGCDKPNKYHCNLH